MEIRLFDVLNNKVDVRDYMFIHDGKIMVNADHVYDVILDTDKVTLHQQMEMFDSKDEMFKKAKAFDEVKEFVTKKLKEEEEKSRILLDDYDYGLNQAYNNVDDIIQEHMEGE